MATITNNEFWRDFFELYRSLPEIWKIKSELYKNKNLKIKGYEMLLEKYKEIDENANLETIKKKLNSIRACYRRELKKVKQSQKSGAGEEDLYSPNLWYFNELDFLKDQEVQIDGVSSMEAEEDDGDENINLGEEHELQPSRKKKRKGPQSERNEIFLRALEQFEKNTEKPDEASTLSSTWETLYRKLETRQQIFANRTIIEVLYQGALGKLDERSCKVFENENDFPTEGPRTSTPYSRRTELPLSERRTSTPFSRHTESSSTETYLSEASHPHEDELTSYQTSPITFSKYAPEQIIVRQQPNTNFITSEHAYSQFRQTASNQQQFGAVSQQHARPVNQQQKTYFSLQELLADKEFS